MHFGTPKINFTVTKQNNSLRVKRNGKGKGQDRQGNALCYNCWDAIFPRGNTHEVLDVDKCLFCVSQMKHQLDATLCRFYFCRVSLHVSGASAQHQEYLKLVRRPLVHVLSLQVSHHISLLGPELNAFRHSVPEIRG